MFLFFCDFEWPDVFLYRSMFLALSNSLPFLSPTLPLSLLVYDLVWVSLWPLCVCVGVRTFFVGICLGKCLSRCPGWRWLTGATIGLLRQWSSLCNLVCHNHERWVMKMLWCCDAVMLWKRDTGLPIGLLVGFVVYVSTIFALTPHRCGA